MFCLIDYNFVLQFLFKTSSACLIQHKSEHEIQIATSLEVGVDLKPLVVRGVGLLEPTCQGATSRVGLVVHPTLIRALCPEPTVSNLDDFPVVFTEPFPFGCPLREQSKWFRSHPSASRRASSVGRWCKSWAGIASFHRSGWSRRTHRELGHELHLGRDRCSTAPKGGSLACFHEACCGLQQTPYTPILGQRKSCGPHSF